MPFAITYCMPTRGPDGPMALYHSQVWVDRCHVTPGNQVSLFTSPPAPNILRDPTHDCPRVPGMRQPARAARRHQACTHTNKSLRKRERHKGRSSRTPCRHPHAPSPNAASSVERRKSTRTTSTDAPPHPQTMRGGRSRTARDGQSTPTHDSFAPRGSSWSSFRPQSYL